MANPSPSCGRWTSQAASTASLAEVQHAGAGSPCAPATGVSFSDSDRSSSSMHGDIAPIMAVAHVDAWVRGEAAPEVDQAANGDIQVQLAALFLKADPHFVLRLEQIEHAA
jgi:hypothetical protein